MLKRSLIVLAVLAMFAATAFAATPAAPKEGPKATAPVRQQLSQQDQERLQKIYQDLAKERERYRELRRTGAPADKLTEQWGKMERLREEARKICPFAGQRGPGAGMRAGRGQGGMHSRQGQGRWGQSQGYGPGRRAGGPGMGYRHGMGPGQMGFRQGRGMGQGPGMGFRQGRGMGPGCCMGRGAGCPFAGK